MKLLVFALSALLAVTGAANAFMVFCDGLVGGGSGGPLGTDYGYQGVVFFGETLTSFTVGLVPNGGIYSIMATDFAGNPLPGWSGSLVSGLWDAYVPATAHGNVSPGPDFQAASGMRWTGPALSSGVYWFGFDADNHTYADVGWDAGSAVTPSSENWADDVGFGTGPVHAPIPEPLSVALMGVGAAVIGLRRRISRP